MSVDLKYLAFTAMLTATLWIPYIVAQVMTNGFLGPQNYVDPTPRPVPPMNERVSSVNGTAFWTMSFFWLRVAHAVVFLAAIPYIRTLIFVLGWVTVIGLFYELMR